MEKTVILPLNSMTAIVLAINPEMRGTGDCPVNVASAG